VSVSCTNSPVRFCTKLRYYSVTSFLLIVALSYSIIQNLHWPVRPVVSRQICNCSCYKNVSISVCVMNVVTGTESESQRLFLRTAGMTLYLGAADLDWSRCVLINLADSQQMSLCRVGCIVRGCVLWWWKFQLITYKKPEVLLGCCCYCWLCCMDRVARCALARRVRDMRSEK